jgi:hypothetical protein
MTEQEWTTSTNSAQLLAWLETPFGIGLRDRHRTTMLFGLACALRALSQEDSAVVWMLQKIEDSAYGIPDTEPHITLAHRAYIERHSVAPLLLATLDERSRHAPFDIANAAALLAVRRLRLSSQQAMAGADREQRAVQAAILRDIHNPFRPVSFLPAWRTDTAVALARQMYDWQQFGAMPILADALQDAGCENEHVLNHCRDLNQVHVRGCWVLDAVLQKS